MAERSKAADCKSVGITHVGSNPTPLILNRFIYPALLLTKFETKLQFHKLYRNRPYRLVLNSQQKNRPTYSTTTLNISKLIRSYRRSIPKFSLTVYGVRPWRLEKLFVKYTRVYNFFLNSLKLPHSLRTNGKVNLKSQKYVGVVTFVKSLYHINVLFSRNFLTTLFRKSIHLNHRRGYKWDQKILLLNFRRQRFFPSIQSLKNLTYVFASLGMFAKLFKKGKSFIKNRLVYFSLVGFLRKVLLFADIFKLILFVKGIPTYLPEMLTALNTPVIAEYKHPFFEEDIDECKLQCHFVFSYFVFLSSRSYSFMKIRKKGRIKRKLTKRLVKLNRKVD